MSKTIKELADALGVSKTAVRKYMTPEFRCEHTETTGNGVITIDSDGCKLIAESMGTKWNQPETTGNQIPETTENTENLTIPRVMWEALQKQLEEKDRQLAARDKQISDLTEANKELAKSVGGAQALHAGTMKQMLPDGSEVPAGEVIEVVVQESAAASVPDEKEILQGFLQDAKKEIDALNAEMAQKQEDAIRNLSWGEIFRMKFKKGKV